MGGMEEATISVERSNSGFFYRDRLICLYRRIVDSHKKEMAKEFRDSNREFLQYWENELNSNVRGIPVVSKIWDRYQKFVETLEEESHFQEYRDEMSDAIDEAYNDAFEVFDRTVFNGRGENRKK